MIQKEEILKKVAKIEDKLLISKILDKAVKSEYVKEFMHSDFLDPYQRKIIGRALQDCEEINYTFYGGYEEAERMIVVFSPNFVPLEHDFFDIVKIIHIDLKHRDSLTHRDYLGALMSLGIKREKIGDILVREESCDIIILTEISEYIRYNLDKIGNVKVDSEVKDADEINIPAARVKEIKATVASLRLDCIASAGFGISRSKIAELIKAERVHLNWEATDSLTKQVQEGDTLSIRGKGRVVLEKIVGNTKKGRIGLVIKKLI